MVKNHTLNNLIASSISSKEKKILLSLFSDETLASLVMKPFSIKNPNISSSILYLTH